MFRLLLLCTLCFPVFVAAQAGWAEIDDIQIVGNKKTRHEIILREIDFCIGDSISLAALKERLEWNELQLMNTGLFSKVKFRVDEARDTQQCVSLKLVLEESWYLYPVPVVELADRNFNVWWDDYNHSLRRINYGMRFYHFNFTGRKDYFKIITQLGYTERYGFQYSLPYLNRRKTIGANLGFDFHRNHEVQYNTIDNVQKFFRADDRFLLDRFDAELSAIYRPAYLTNHFFGLFYHQNRVDDHIVREFNPEFFENGERLQRYFSIAYRFNYDQRNIKPYPTDGRFFEALFVKDGLGIFDDVNTLSADFDYREYSPFGKKWNLENIVKTRISFIRQKPPYYNRSSLGFGRSFVRGYEHYVVDGLDYFLTKNSLRFEVLNKEYKIGKWVPISAFRTVPIKAYLALNADAGVMNNPYAVASNSLDNKFLYGGGVGLNLVLYYNKVFKIEYSWNGLGEQGIFVHTELGF